MVLNYVYNPEFHVSFMKWYLTYILRVDVSTKADKAPGEGSINTGTRGIIYCQPKWFLMHSLPMQLDVSKDLKRKQNFTPVKD